MSTDRAALQIRQSIWFNLRKVQDSVDSDVFNNFIIVERKESVFVKLTRHDLDLNLELVHTVFNNIYLHLCNLSHGKNTLRNCKRKNLGKKQVEFKFYSTQIELNAENRSNICDDCTL